LLELRVRARTGYDRRVPDRLSTLAAIDTAKASERPFRLGFAKGRWRINDRVFEMGVSPIEVARGSVETWLIRNYHTSMPHAMHLHGFHFEVLARETSPDTIGALAIDGAGRLATDLGHKDTVLVWPGESVRIAIDFTHPFPGAQTYMFHCHNLEHEDGGMSQVETVAALIVQ
jgi:suppressor of ftsI/bilirubin oxidase